MRSANKEVITLESDFKLNGFIDVVVNACMWFIIDDPQHPKEKHENLSFFSKDHAKSAKETHAKLIEIRRQFFIFGNDKMDAIIEEILRYRAATALLKGESKQYLKILDQYFLVREILTDDKKERSELTLNEIQNEQKILGQNLKEYLTNLIYAPDDVAVTASIEEITRLLKASIDSILDKRLRVLKDSSMTPLVNAAVVVHRELNRIKSKSSVFTSSEVNEIIEAILCYRTALLQGNYKQCLDLLDSSIPGVHRSVADEKEGSKPPFDQVAFRNNLRKYLIKCISEPAPHLKKDSRSTRIDAKHQRLFMEKGLLNDTKHEKESKKTKSEDGSEKIKEINAFVSNLLESYFVVVEKPSLTSSPESKAANLEFTQTKHKLSSIRDNKEMPAERKTPALAIVIVAYREKLLLNDKFNLYLPTLSTLDECLKKAIPNIALEARTPPTTADKDRLRKELIAGITAYKAPQPERVRPVV